MTFHYVKMLLTHNAHKDISEDKRSNTNPQEDVNGREKPIHDLPDIIQHLVPLVKGEQLDQCHHGTTQGTAKRIQDKDLIHSMVLHVL